MFDRHAAWVTPAPGLRVETPRSLRKDVRRARTLRRALKRTGKARRQDQGTAIDPDHNAINGCPYRYQATERY
jgi:hypothetical protein